MVLRPSAPEAQGLLVRSIVSIVPPPQLIGEVADGGRRGAGTEPAAHELAGRSTVAVYENGNLGRMVGQQHKNKTEIAQNTINGGGVLGMRERRGGGGG